MSTDTQVGNLCAWHYAFTELIWMIQAKDLYVASSCEARSQLNSLRSAIETNFYATFKPSPSVSGSEVELNINGIWGATVRARGFTPHTELKGKIRIQTDITKVPNSYLIARVGNDLVFLFRSREAGEPIIGGATFPYPFKNDIDWRGNLEWKALVPIPPKMDGLAPGATPE
jgi:hypothetical protein